MGWVSETRQPGEPHAGWPTPRVGSGGRFLALVPDSQERPQGSPGEAEPRRRGVPRVQLPRAPNEGRCCPLASAPGPDRTVKGRPEFHAASFCPPRAGEAALELRQGLGAGTSASFFLLR